MSGSLGKREAKSNFGNWRLPNLTSCCCIGVSSRRAAVVDVVDVVLLAVAVVLVLVPGVLLSLVKIWFHKTLYSN